MSITRVPATDQEEIDEAKAVARYHGRRVNADGWEIRREPPFTGELQFRVMQWNQGEKKWGEWQGVEKMKEKYKDLAGFKDAMPKITQLQAPANDMALINITPIKWQFASPQEEEEDMTPFEEEGRDAIGLYEGYLNDVAVSLMNRAKRAVYYAKLAESKGLSPAVLLEDKRHWQGVIDRISKVEATKIQPMKVQAKYHDGALIGDPRITVKSQAWEMLKKTLRRAEAAIKLIEEIEEFEGKSEGEAGCASPDIRYEVY